MKYRALLASVLLSGSASAHQIPPDWTPYPGYVTFGMSKAQAIGKVRKYNTGFALHSKDNVVIFEAPAGAPNRQKWSYSFKLGKLIESSEAILAVSEERCRHIVESFRNLSRNWPGYKLEQNAEVKVVSEDKDAQRFVYSTPETYIEVSRTAPGSKNGLCDVTWRFVEPTEWKEEHNVAAGT